VTTKAFARFLYARIPGAAAFRFALKDIATTYISKPEFGGLSHVNDGLIVDIGANRGQSIAAFRRFKPKSNIIAFEPEPRSADKITSRFANDPAVSMHRVALADKSGEIRFFVPHYGFWNCDGMAALTYDGATSWLRDPTRMAYFNETILTVQEYAVPCKTLDSFNLCPTLIKLHTQKTEMDVLKGAQETLRRCSPALMCAFVSPEIVNFLSGFDYRPYFYKDGRLQPGCANPYDTTFTWFFTS
jgi:FkbM family methyltransferase